MTVANKNEARRFIVLVDELYEHRCKMLCSAAVEPAHLFVPPESIDKSKGENARTNASRVESDLREELLEKKGVSDFAGQSAQSRALDSDNTAHRAHKRGRYAAGRKFALQRRRGGVYVCARRIAPARNAKRAVPDSALGRRAAA